MNFMDAFDKTEPAPEYQPLPAGIYAARVVSGAFQQTRKGDNAYVGPCWAKWIVFDFDRADLAEAMADARKLAAALLQRYPMVDGTLPFYLSGSKRFHVYLDLAHEPPPVVGFNAVCRTLAEGLAAAAGVRIDMSIYDANRILRLPNSRHPKTGVYKRRIDADALFRLDVAAVRELARYPAGDGLPTVVDRVPELVADWEGAVQATARQTEARSAVRREGRLRAHQAAVVRRLQRAALVVALDTGRVNAEDVRFRVPIPRTVTPKTNGAAFRELGELVILAADGYRQSVRPEAHRRPLTEWLLADRAAAVEWLAENPENPTDPSVGVAGPSHLTDPEVRHAG